MQNKSVLTICAALAACLSFSQSSAQTFIKDTIEVVGSTGSFITGSVNSAGTKNDGNMVTISTSTNNNRGWAVFDLSKVPAGATISSADVVFTTFSSTNSTAANKILGFMGNPATTAGNTLYTQIQNGVEFNSSSWTVNTLNTKAVNANGIAFLQSHLGDTIVVGFQRGSTNAYNIYGYPGTQAQKPKLVLTYSAIPCSGKPDGGIAIADETTLCAGYPLRIVDTSHSRNKATVFGISWVWQQSLDSMLWSDIPGTAGKDTFETTASIKSYYRMKVVCGPSADTAYSNVISLTIPPAYACYCYSRATGADNDSSDIGAFRIGDYAVSDGGAHLQNPKAIKGSTNRFAEGVINLFIDSTYTFDLYHTMRSNVHRDTRVTIFMDFNRNFQYDIPEERVYTGKTTVTNFFLNDTIHIPAQAILGEPVGMRVIVNNDIAPNTPSDSACGTYFSGETEDFVVQFSKAFPVSVNSISSERTFEVYPNPTAGRFTIKLDGSYQAVDVSITNITGQMVFAESYTPNGSFDKELNLQGSAPGVYFVQIVADGQKMIQRIMLQ